MKKKKTGSKLTKGEKVIIISLISCLIGMILMVIMHDFPASVVVVTFIMTIPIAHYTLRGRGNPYVFGIIYTLIVFVLFMLFCWLSRYNSLIKDIILWPLE